MQLSFQICVGVIAALSTSANGLTFRDRLTQDVNGTTLTVVHGIQEETAVTLDADAHTQKSNGWEFNTEGRPDDEAVIRPIDSSASLVCREGSVCELDFNGDDQAYRVSRINGTTFSIQDTLSSLYVSRSTDLKLELSNELTKEGHFKLQKITNWFQLHPFAFDFKSTDRLTWNLDSE
ncbi:unnamed protein product [Penicillium salamii]|uniref:Uncharacterized protein n=1 Tax=Penicillium salamii TaxID=1612424 RepID=A0A9W4JGC9_9EURO|nr:unnamed protein product [Penicillium salamii]